jgi:hypothetical protein
VFCLESALEHGRVRTCFLVVCSGLASTAATHSQPVVQTGRPALQMLLLASCHDGKTLEDAPANNGPKRAEHHLIVTTLRCVWVVLVRGCLFTKRHGVVSEWTSSLLRAAFCLALCRWTSISSRRFICQAIAIDCT